jgi:Ca-activated chloride channel family protein
MIAPRTCARRSSRATVSGCSVALLLTLASGCASDEDAADAQASGTSDASGAGGTTGASTSAGSGVDTNGATTGGSTGTSGASGESGFTTGTSSAGTDTDGGSSASGGTDGTSGGEPGSTGTTDASTTDPSTTDATTTDGASDTDADTETDTDAEPVCDDVTPVTLYLSPDDSNSMASPVLLRTNLLDSFGSLWGTAVRTYEFFNYYSFTYPPAAADTLDVHAAMVQDPEIPGRYTMQLAVVSEAVTQMARPPINVTLVLDTSGSMSGRPMEMLKESCRAMAAALKPGDRVSMVTWDVAQTPVLAGYEVTGPNDAVLLARIDALTPGGGTNLNAGLEAGYELAQTVFDPTRINRAVLISDGGANVGVTSKELIAQNAASNGGDGVYLVGVGVGTGTSYNDELMNEVTDAGKGASVFIHDSNEAWKVFNQNFVNTFMVAARDVQIRMDLPPGFEIVSFSGEEFSANPDEVEPQNIAPNDAMVFYQAVETCAPAAVGADTPIAVIARYRDALTFEERETRLDTTFGALLDGPADPNMLKGAAIFTVAEAIKAAQSSTDVVADIAAADAALAAARLALPMDRELDELQAMLGAIR